MDKDKVSSIFHNKILQRDNKVVDVVERSQYTPLLIIALQELMREKVISMQNKIENAEEEFERNTFFSFGNLEMYWFTHDLHNFYLALLDQPLDEKCCTILFNDLLGQLEAIQKE
jgi:hypothetical protein